MNTFKKTYWLSAVVTCGLGVVLAIWPGMSIRIVCMMIGAVIAVFGGWNMINAIRTKDGGLFTSFFTGIGLLLLILGIWLLVIPETIVALFPIIIGVILLIHGVIDFTETIELKNLGYERWIFALLMSILLIGLAIMILVNPFGSVEMVVRVIGFVMIYDGLKDLILSIMLRITRGRMGKAIKDMQVIDVDIIHEEDIK